MAKAAAKRAKPTKSLVERTPVFEWIAAGMGLLLTLSVIGYLIFDGLTAGDGPPVLRVLAARSQPTANGHLVPITVRNAGATTAADVEVRATLERGGVVIEERRSRFSRVPSEGEAKGGVIFATDPADAQVRVTAEGYADP